MSRANRVMQILAAMTQEERLEFFDEVSETYCVNCAVELPDEDSKEPDHECPLEDDADDADDGDPDEEDDEEETDELANEPE